MIDADNPLTKAEVTWRIKEILKAAGVKALITGAKISAVFPDGRRAIYEDLTLDTERRDLPGHSG